MMNFFMSEKTPECGAILIGFIYFSQQGNEALEETCKEGVSCHRRKLCLSGAVS